MKKRILVVDDDSYMVDKIMESLTREGFDCRGALNGIEALEKLSQESFDLITTGLVMPKMNGFDLMHEMKNRGIKIPTIVISGYATLPVRDETRKLGALKFIKKPFKVRELLQTVKEIFEHHNAH